LVGLREAYSSDKPDIHCRNNSLSPLPRGTIYVVISAIMMVVLPDQIAEAEACYGARSDLESSESKIKGKGEAAGGLEEV
jgi:hypothetical protein